MLSDSDCLTPLNGVLPAQSSGFEDFSHGFMLHHGLSLNCHSGSRWPVVSNVSLNP